MFSRSGSRTRRVVDLYEPEKSDYVLEKLLHVVWFLDHCKQFGVFPKEFCMFQRSSSIKSVSKGFFFFSEFLVPVCHLTVFSIQFSDLFLNQ